jgi:hypothetical protein
VFVVGTKRIPLLETLSLNILCWEPILVAAGCLLAAIRWSQQKTSSAFHTEQFPQPQRGDHCGNLSLQISPLKNYKEPNMIIIGCDYHPGFQQIAYVDTKTGELQERRLRHREEAETFYRELASGGVQVRVGMEASGHARWFERLLAELKIELWMGDAAKIRAKRVRKQKTDRQDAQLILRLMLKDDFPQIWVPGLGQSRAAATALASTPYGAGPHAQHESVAGGGDQ